MNRRFAIQAASGRMAVAGVGILRATDVSLSGAVQEVTARSGCDTAPWFRGVDLLDVTGQFTLQDLTAEMLSAITGGTLVAAGSGHKVVERGSYTAAAAAITLAGVPLLNEDGKVAGAFWIQDANGEQVLSQIAVDGTPAAGEFAYNSSDTDALKLNAAQNGATIYGTYAYAAAGGPSVKVKDTSVPPLVSLLLPACGIPLELQGTKGAVGLYCPRVRFLSWDLSAGAAGGELQGQQFQFGLLPGSDGELFRLLYPNA